MPPRISSQTITGRGDSTPFSSRSSRKKAIPLCLIKFVIIFLSGTCIDFASDVTNSILNANHPQTGHHFLLFRTARWNPTRPQSEPWVDNLTFALLLAVPCLSAVALKFFFRKRKSIQPIAWPRLLLGNGLILLFFFSIMLLLAEVRVRFFMDTTDSIGFTKLSERWITRHWHVNSAGCRDNIEYSPAIQPGKRRVSFVGDSFTAGHGIKDVNARFPNLLRALHPDWEVHLLANVGLDTGSELALLKKAKSRGYQFDEVVLVYCLNDVCDLMMAPGEPFEGRLPSADEPSPRFTRGSYFLDLVYNRYKASQNPFVRDYFSFVKDGYRGKYWDKQQARLKELYDFVQSHGGHLTVVTFPFLNALGPKYDYSFVHDELDQFWKEMQVSHLDLLPVYTGHTSSELTVNVHDAHPNELADKIAADAINRVLWPGFTNHVHASVQPGSPHLD